MPTMEASILDGIKIMEQQTPILFKFHFLIVEILLSSSFFSLPSIIKPMIQVQKCFLFNQNVKVYLLLPENECSRNAGFNFNCLSLL